MLQVGERGKYRYLLFGFFFCSRDKQVFLCLGNSRQGKGGDRDEEQQEGQEAGV